MKHRRNKVKREHGIIQNALDWLESLSRLAEVTDIIPGVIDVNRSSERGIVYKYETQTGCKLLLKSNGSIQEAFVVTKYPERVREWVKKEFPLNSSQITDGNISLNGAHNVKKQISRIPAKSEVSSVNIPSAQKRQSKNQKRSQGKSLFSFYRQDDVSLNVADRLDKSSLKALKQFKKSLENVKMKVQKQRIKGDFKK